MDRYNDPVRRKSPLNRAKRLDRIERARRMTPEERLAVSANLSQAVKEIESAGKHEREEEILKGTLP